MLSDDNLERLITEKRREIEREKIILGLSPASDACQLQDIEDKENDGKTSRKTVRIAEGVLSERHDNGQGEPEETTELPPDLERYIRRYLGLPVMLKAGEYSPNNPALRAAVGGGDAFRGLGDYERRQHALRKARQMQYREYLDQQAKKKQEEKEQAERERREREERERQREEERDKLRVQLERDTREAEKRRAGVESVNVKDVPGATKGFRKKVDTGVQVGISRPLSVAVQTDDLDLYRLSLSPTKSQLTQAERELSPRTVVDNDERPIQPAPWAKDGWRQQNCDKNTDLSRENRLKTDLEQGNRLKTDSEQENRLKTDWAQDNRSNIDSESNKLRTDIHWKETRVDKNLRRRSYGDFDERSPTISKKTSRDRLLSDLRHTYMPSIFDADAIHMRNLQAEKEALERRQFYQQELKNQILEQQRIREERKNREKMLEQAEMRRLEEQLRMLRCAQDNETGRQRDIMAQMKEHSTEYERKRTSLQKEIDLEKQKLFKVASRHRRAISENNGDSNISNFSTRELKRLPFSTNIPENSIFSPNYDVDSYLRKNLNPKKEVLTTNFDIKDKLASPNQKFDSKHENEQTEINNDKIGNVVEKVLIHERPKDKEKPKYEPNFLKHLDEFEDDNPIPVLRHSPKEISSKESVDETTNNGMKLIENKWKVPAVQKNIFKTVPQNDGKNLSILTQLGSIRRQLQLEQLRLDNMMSKTG